ncbi:O-antigen polymerase [Vagococcus humatus]|uniref:Oligosaccharide repeat unit polymerase n=1 Tax=Vagococcus humatus TaxID=1889241 RepID=A0A3R9ZXB3_9ENTE|nr:O-antigen polymerase [Vagococcus humatus]RST89910.1 hypothetical protein C7P63_02195 [Vagococcus humatus]
MIMQIFLYITFILMIFFMILSNKFYNQIFNPVFLILFFYLIWFLMGRSGYLGQYKPTYVSSLFLASNIILLCISTVVSTSSKKIWILKMKQIRMSDNYKNIILQFVRWFSFILSVFIFINLFKKILGGDIMSTQVRNISYSVSYNSDEYMKIYYNPTIYYIYQYFIRGFAFFDMVYSTCMFFGSKKKYELITIANFLLFVTIMQSRIEVLKLVIFIILIVCLSNIKITEKGKKYLIRVSVIISIPTLIVFSLRTNSNVNVIKHSIDSFIIDHSGSNYMFSKFFDEYNEGLRLSNYSIIQEYIGGINSFIDSLKTLFNIPILDNDEMLRYIRAPHYIGSSDHYNYFYTMYFKFLDTGGYLGCYLFSVFLGVFLGFSYNKYMTKNNIKSLYILSLLTYISVMGTYNYILSGTSSLILFLGLLIVEDNKVQIENR